jgi:hypothetical protein
MEDRELIKIKTNKAPVKINIKINLENIKTYSQG